MQVESKVKLLVEGIERINNGEAIGAVWDSMADEYECSPKTIYRWLAKVNGHPKSKWEELLAPGFKGRTKLADFTPEAFEYFKTLLQSGQNLSISEAHEQLTVEAKRNDWVVPSLRTLQRRAKLEGVKSFRQRNWKWYESVDLNE